jgi:hypothetical protein
MSCAGFLQSHSVDDNCLVVFSSKKTPLGAHRAGFLFPNSTTTSGVRTLANNNTDGNYRLKHGAKV